MRNHLLLGAVALGMSSLSVGVGSAQALDLSKCNYSNPASCTGTTNSGNAIFTAIAPDDPAGSGVLDSFLRLQATGRETTEEGLNTNVNQVFDNKEGAFTHDVLLGDIPFENGYMNLLLDMNEDNGRGGGRGSIDHAYLDLVDLRIYVSNNALTSTQLNSRTTVTQLAGLNLTTIFDLDRTVRLYDQNQGSGRADLIVQLKQELFKNTNPNQYLYLYSKFDNADGGYEEWAYRNPDKVPTPTVVLPLFAGMLGLASRRQKKNKEAEDHTV